MIRASGVRALVVALCWVAAVLAAVPAQAATLRLPARLSYTGSPTAPGAATPLRVTIRAQGTRAVDGGNALLGGKARCRLAAVAYVLAVGRLPFALEHPRRVRLTVGGAPTTAKYVISPFHAAGDDGSGVGAAMGIPLPDKILPGLPERLIYVAIQANGPPRCDRALERRIEPIVRGVRVAVTGTYTAPPSDPAPALRLTSAPHRTLKVPLVSTLSSTADIDGDGTPDLLAETADHGVLVLLNPFAAVARVVRIFRGSPFGRTVIPAGDLDGDGHADLLAALASEHPGSRRADQVGRTVVISGARAARALDPATLPTVTRTPACSPAGIDGTPWLGVAGDLDRDGRNDVLVGDDNRCNERQRLLTVYSGAEIAGPHPTALMHIRLPVRDLATETVVAAGDMTGDGRPDIALIDLGVTGDAISIVPGRTDGGTVDRNGASVITLRTGLCDMPSDVAAPGDVDGDGTADLIIAAPADDCERGPRSSGGVFVVRGGPGLRSGALTAVASRIDGGRAGGTAESVAAGPGGSYALSLGPRDNDYPDSGAAVILGGLPAPRSVATIGTHGYTALGPGFDRGNALALLPDVDGDGRPELAINTAGGDDVELVRSAAATG